MTDTAKLEASVGAHEGFVAVPAKDTRGRWSFAKGRCLETHPLTGAEWRVLLDNGWILVRVTEEGADWLMDTALAADVEALSRVIPCWNQLNDARQNALTEIAYQLGVSGMLEFHQMLEAIPSAIRSGDWSVVKAQALDSDWNRELLATGSHRAELVAEQLFSGVFAD